MGREAKWAWVRIAVPVLASFVVLTPLGLAHTGDSRAQRSLAQVLQQLIAPVQSEVPAPVEPATAEQIPFHIVIDPGHGGSNTGAAGVIEGVYEKRFALELARDVGKALLRYKNVQVSFTRTDDSYVTLRERARRANRAQADVFVSLHGNASPGRDQSGFETYLLSAGALQIDARAIRQGDGPPRDADSEISSLLDDVERGVALPWAAELAASIQKRLAEARPESPNRGVRQAPMDVLMGPTMPAVLVEVGFFDHPTEGAELMRRDTRKTIAEAVAQGIIDFRRLWAAR